MNKNKIDFICFGGEDWWYHNRGHIDFQLMKRYAKNGTVLYINSIVMQKPKFSQGKKFIEKLVRKTKSIFNGLKKSDAGFWVYSPFSLPVHHINWLKKLNEIILSLQVYFVAKKLKINHPIVWVACPAACNVAIKMKKTNLIYQRTDRFEEYPNVDSKVIVDYDNELKKQADLTLFVSYELFKFEKKHCKKALYLDHGVDYDLFANADSLQKIPEDIQSIKKPIIGYFGAISGANTVDIELIEKLADSLPNMSFALIGKAASDYKDLRAKPNVWMLGQKPYEQIPNYGRCFDVAIMPWRQNHWVEACNPIKLKEYLALGKPIVSTPFTELNKYLDVTYQAKNPEDFVNCIIQAIHEDDGHKTMLRRKKVQPFSWESKAEMVIKELADG